MGIISMHFNVPAQL